MKIKEIFLEPNRISNKHEKKIEFLPSRKPENSIVCKMFCMKTKNLKLTQNSMKDNSNLEK